MGPGVDPHLYKPTASDVARLQRADVLFYSGLQLEGKMEDLLIRMKRTGRSIHALTDSLPPSSLIKIDPKSAQYDPHIWMDASLWALCPGAVAKHLAAAQPQDREYYEKNADALALRLQSLHKWAVEQAACLPESQRVLITSHDAFNYFGRAYGFDVIALQGISTVAEAGLADFTRLVDLIKARQVPAIFVETSVSPNTLQRISRDAGVRIGGELFSDALGGLDEVRDGHSVGTYEGMLRYNLETILNALKSTPTAESSAAAAAIRR
jgi:manganese/zinc/iron transport system substrate-binding protein